MSDRGPEGPPAKPRRGKNRGTFANLLNRLRKRSGVTQEELAERSGVALSTIRNYEQGWRDPTYNMIVKLATPLGASLGDFDPSQDDSALPGEPAEASGEKTEGSRNPKTRPKKRPDKGKRGSRKKE